MKEKIQLKISELEDGFYFQNFIDLETFVLFFYF